MKTAESKIHRVKCWSKYFAKLKSGEKTFEVRKNDRDYKVGDTLIQEEWLPDTEEYTGDSLEFEITYILYGGQFGIDADSCVMSISRQQEQEKVDGEKKTE